MEQKNAAAEAKLWPLMEKFEDMLQLVDEIEATGIFPTGERYKHEKRGTTYDIYGVGYANSAAEYSVLFEQDFDSRSRGYGMGDSGTTPVKKNILFDRDEVVIYRDVQSGALSIRAKDEFLDGRFTLLPRLPGQSLPDPARALIERVEGGAASPITNGQPPRSTSSGQQGGGK